MLSTHKIERLIDSADWSTLLEALVENGRPMPLALRLQLLEDASLPVAALGLALQRLVELTYAPSAPALEAAVRLSDLLHRAVHTDTDAAPCGAAVALGAAGLADLARQADECGRGLAVPLAERIDASLRASAWLLAQCLPAPAAGGPSGGRAAGPDAALDAAVVLWQAAHRPSLRMALERGVNVAALERDVRRLGWWKRSDCAAVLALAHTQGLPRGRGGTADDADALWADRRAA